MRPLSAFLLVVAGSLAGCSTQITPYSSASVAMPATDAEQRIWSKGDNLDARLRRSGQLVEDEKLLEYLQGVMDRLFPEFAGRTRVGIIRAPQLNAFALANGSVYVNEGLLARLENEAQLATVLAHEGIHFVNRHGIQSLGTLKESLAFGALVSVLAGPAGGPLLGNFLATASVTGSSQALESDADALALERLKAAGYDAREAPKVFARIASERRAAGLSEPIIFSSHPRLHGRVEDLERRSADAPRGGIVRAERYRKATEALRVRNIENELSLGRYRQVLHVLEDPREARHYPAHADYYRGEAYRMRGRAGDAARAETAYLEAIEADPAFARSYHALGILHLKRGDYAEARAHLQTYIAATPASAERRYAESYLELARKGEAP